MKTASFSEFRKHAAELLDAVEKGEVVRIMRYGKPVADVIRVREDAPSWKTPPPQLRLRGVSLSKAILEDRKRAPR